MAYLRSPIFYMGNKFKLLDFILPLFPSQCDTFYDLFGGSAVVSLNYRNKCNKVIYNDFNQNIVRLVKMLLENDPMELNDYFEKKKKQYGLRTFSVKDKGPDKYNTYKEMEKGFLQLRKDYNESVEREYKDLYLLSCYSINHLMRFNSNSDFNVSVGTDSYSPKILKQIINFHNILNGIELWNKNVFEIDFDKIIKEENVFCYFDPPYSSSLAVYNESHTFGGWKIDDDLKLFEILDKLANNNINFGLSNVFVNRDKENTHLIDWCNKNKDRYYVYHTNKNYNPFSRGNSESDEVYITNYKSNSTLF